MCCCPDSFNPTVVRLRLRTVGKDPYFAQLSIPLWCDCDERIWNYGYVKNALSIPLWCDCDTLIVKAGELVAQTFNPTVVRLRLPNPTP